jgi:hypothetical protein
MDQDSRGPGFLFFMLGPKKYSGRRGVTLDSVFDFRRPSPTAYLNYLKVAINIQKLTFEVLVAKI